MRRKPQVSGECGETQAPANLGIGLGLDQNLVHINTKVIIIENWRS